jgi:hypothetical protein
VREFVSIAEKLPYEVFIKDGTETRHGRARTLLDVLQSISWNEVYIYTEDDKQDPYNSFQKYIVP